MGERLQKTLSLRDVGKIQALFDEQNWPIDNEEGSIFSKFCKRARNLPDDESRELFYELTGRYFKISDTQYLNLLIQAVDKVFVTYPEFVGCKKIFIRQLVAPEDYEERLTKSSARVWYTFHQAELMEGHTLRKYDVDMHEDLRSNDIDAINRGKAFVIMVDDYVGTGGTAEKAVQPLLGMKVCKERIIILSMVAQQDGIDYLHGQGFKVITTHIRKKGITDYNTPEDTESKKRIMKRIENNLGVNVKFELGFGQSEGLVTLIRTPNNTFPVFWYDPPGDKSAPFLRKK